MTDYIEKIIPLIFELRKGAFEQKAKFGSNTAFIHLIALKYIKERQPLMKDIAGFLGIAPPSATSLVNTLSKAEYILRKEDPNDRRIVKIELSKKGEEFLQSHMNVVAQGMRARLSKLSEHELQDLENILRKIIP